MNWCPRVSCSAPSRRGALTAAQSDDDSMAAAGRRGGICGVLSLACRGIPWMFRAVALVWAERNLEEAYDEIKDVTCLSTGIGRALQFRDHQANPPH